MVSVSPGTAALFTLLPLLIYLLCRRYDPKKPWGRALGQCVAGVMLLCLWNLLSPVPLGVNPLSAYLTGSLGLPGLGLLYLLRLIG